MTMSEGNTQCTRKWWRPRTKRRPGKACEIWGARLQFEKEWSGEGPTGKVVFGEKETLPPRPDRTEGVSPGLPGERASQAGGSARIKPLSVWGAARRPAWVGQREWGEREVEAGEGSGLLPGHRFRPSLWFMRHNWRVWAGGSGTDVGFDHLTLPSVLLTYRKGYDTHSYFRSEMWRCLWRTYRL